MKLHPEPALTLLHTCTHGTLATHSTTLPGYPFATAVPYVLDDRHRPILCISALAAHTKNLLADPRVSLSVVQPGADEVQDTARLTLVADAVRIEPINAVSTGEPAVFEGNRVTSRPIPLDELPARQRVSP